MKRLDSTFLLAFQKKFCVTSTRWHYFVSFADSHRILHRGQSNSSTAGWGQHGSKELVCPDGYIAYGTKLLDGVSKSRASVIPVVVHEMQMLLLHTEAWLS